MEEILRELIDKFNKKALEDEKMRKELEGIKRTIQVEFKDGESYNFMIDNARILNFSKGAVANPDLKIISDTKTFDALMKREMGPMKALATGKLKIEGSLEDKLRLRKLL